MAYRNDIDRERAEFMLDQMSTACVIAAAEYNEISARVVLSIPFTKKSDLHELKRLRAEMTHVDEVYYSEKLAHLCMSTPLLISSNQKELLLDYPKLFKLKHISSTEVYKRAYNILKCRYHVNPGGELYALAFPEEKDTSVKGLTIIFLDIDGVLNSRSGAIRRKIEGDTPRYGIHEENVEPFLEFIRTFEDCEIVVSSTWRCGYSGGYSKFAKEYFSHYPEIRNRIVGFTPHIPSNDADYEIKAWLSEHQTSRGAPISRIVWIDDSTYENNAFATRFQVKTELSVGFTYDTYLQAKKDVISDRFVFTGINPPELIDTSYIKMSPVKVPQDSLLSFRIKETERSMSVLEKDDSSNKSMTEKDCFGPPRPVKSDPARAIRFIDE